MGSVYVGQCSTVRFVGSWISFLSSFFFLVDCFGQMESRNVAGALQGILTQGPTPDPKCKLITSSFLTLPRLLDCLICTRNAMSIVLLLQMIEGGIGRGA